MLAALLSHAWTGDAGGSSRKRRRRYIHDGIVSTDPAILRAMFDEPSPPPAVTRRRKRTKAPAAHPFANEVPALPQARDMLSGIFLEQTEAAMVVARRIETSRHLEAIRLAAIRRRELEDEDDIETLIMARAL